MHIVRILCVRVLYAYGVGWIYMVVHIHTDGSLARGLDPPTNVFINIPLCPPIIIIWHHNHPDETTKIRLRIDEAEDGNFNCPRYNSDSVTNFHDFLVITISSAYI